MTPLGPSRHPSAVPPTRLRPSPPQSIGVALAGGPPTPYPDKE